ncbi:MAG: molybdopterin biosynthesis protein [Deltaproteobacteria bacterium]
MARKRYLDKKPLDEARAALLAAATPLASAERVGVEDALGRVTAGAIAAVESVPHYHGAAMDGIAIRAEDSFGASEGRAIEFELGTPDTATRPFSYIDTGNALPIWANAVVMIERVFAGAAPAAAAPTLAPVDSAPAFTVDDGCCGPDEEPGHGHGEPSFAEPISGTGARQVHVRAASTPWQHIRLVGEDVVASEPLLPRGHGIRPYDIAALLAAGVYEIAVQPRPRVAILPTGDELIEPGEDRQPGRIVEFNSRMIAAFVREWGGEPIRLAPVVDDPAVLRVRLAEAAREADVVCVIAGSSAGEHDFTAAALADLGELLAHGVDVMPGKPVILARLAQGDGGAGIAIGIPGYPVSAAIICREFLEPLLAHLVGTAMRDRPKVRAIVPRKLPSRLGQEEFVRVTLGRVAERLIVSPLARGAGAITTMVKADGFLRVPPLVEGINAGEEVEVELLRPEQEVRGTILVTGSHDATLGLLEDVLKQELPSAKLATSSVGSLAGLLALGRGEAHIAATHLLDPDTGDYNLPDIARLLPDLPLRIFNLAVREQGLIVAPGNPLGLAAIADLGREGLRFVNRQSGAGTRVLLDFLLDKNGMDPDTIAGYDREVFTHTSTAVAVSSGLVDVGMGVRSAAAALGLDFVAIESEDYDLVLRADFAESAPGEALIAVLRSEALRTAIESFPGYDTSRTGTEKIR